MAKAKLVIVAVTEVRDGPEDTATAVYATAVDGTLWRCFPDAKTPTWTKVDLPELEV